MKIQLFFDSVDEFAVFVLSASSIRFDLMFQRIKTDFPRKDFLNSVDMIKIDNTSYSVKPHRYTEPQNIDYSIINYMLNDTQIEYDSVFIKFNDDRDAIIGSQNIRKYINNNLPDVFLLRVGWRTDYDEFLFIKST